MKTLSCVSEYAICFQAEDYGDKRLFKRNLQALYFPGEGTYPYCKAGAFAAFFSRSPATYVDRIKKLTLLSNTATVIILQKKTFSGYC